MTAPPVFVYVEDDPVSRNIMEVLLCRVMGYDQLTVFTDSTDFMAKIEGLSAKPDVVFLDIHVHPYNGFQMLDMLRNHEQYKNATIVALTASVMNKEVEQIHTAGFDGGIAKPLDQSQFSELVERILRKEKVWRI